MINNTFGRIKLASLVLVVLLAAGVYYGIEVGGVFFRKLKLEEAVRQQISFAGQLEDEAIRQQLISEVRGMNLPPQAQRIGLMRTEGARALRITISYAEPVNLLFTQTEIPIRIQVNRRF